MMDNKSYRSKSRFDYETKETLADSHSRSIIDLLILLAVGIFGFMIGLIAQ